MPGPWGGFYGADGAFVIVGGEGLTLCERAPWPHRAAESAANACLIAAAPDLLASLREAVSALELVDDDTAMGLYVDFWGMLADARAAIAKAEGRAVSPDDGAAGRVAADAGGDPNG